ncbi:hypothetical protein AB0L75_16375 [Streptomyces sp. NPDC052101]|uniref:hypothetical protein n=1 Tax=Streptomyces sp. NPDC052101 TaxID=3155763 RepID=UPI003433E661
MNTAPEKMQAAQSFVDEWACLASTLVDDYECHMTCSEAEALAALFRAFGDTFTAEEVMRAHSEKDDEDDEPHGVNIVDGEEAE